jgi:hypothetical protein
MTWDEANAQADAAITAIDAIQRKGVTDLTAPLLADLQRQLDEANEALDQIEYEEGVRQRNALP